MKVQLAQALARIANRAVRPVFQMVSGRKLYRHPSRLDRGYVMEKLLTFHREHQTPPVEIVGDLQQAARQIWQLFSSDFYLSWVLQFGQ